MSGGSGRRGYTETEREWKGERVGEGQKARGVGEGESWRDGKREGDCVKEEKV